MPVRQQGRKQELRKEVEKAYALDKPPPRGIVRVYTDGSQQEGCKGQDGKQYAGYGVWYGDGNRMNESGPIEGPRQTNNRAQMMAFIQVLEEAPAQAYLQLCVDSQLVTDGMTLWIGPPKRRGWRTKGGKEISNRDLRERLSDLEDGREGETHWIKVPSRTGVEGNERADELAEEGVRKHGVPLKSAAREATLGNEGGRKRAAPWLEAKGERNPRKQRK